MRLGVGQSSRYSFAFQNMLQAAASHDSRAVEALELFVYRIIRGLGLPIMPRIVNIPEVRRQFPIVAMKRRYRNPT